MTRVFGIIAIVLNFGALIIQVLVSVSPSIQALDIVRTNYRTGVQVTPNGVPDVTQVRFGTWGTCYDSPPNVPCSKKSFAYTLNVTNADETKTATISASNTRGLISHPIAAGVTLISLILAFLSTTIRFMVPASLVSLLAALATIAAFAVDIFFYKNVEAQMKGLGAGGIVTKISLAPWITLVAFVLLLLSAGITCFGYTQRRLDGALQKQGKIIDAVNNFMDNFKGIVNDKK